MKENRGKRMTGVKVLVIVLVVVAVACIGAAMIVMRNAAYQAGYDTGYADGLSKGHRENTSGNSLLGTILGSGNTDTEAAGENRNGCDASPMDGGATYSTGYDAGYRDALAAYGLDPENIANAEEDSWPYTILTGCWTEVGELVFEEPQELMVSEVDMSLAAGGTESSFTYRLPQNAYTQERIVGEIYIELVNCKAFVHLILHEEELEDGSVIPILSATIVELDGRGEVIIAEFAKTEDADLLPQDFRSSARMLREEQKVPPMRRMHE